MSLDVYLIKDTIRTVPGTGIFVKENGTTRQITKEEWDDIFPGCEIAYFSSESTDVIFTESDYVFDGNVTHNLVPVAKVVGLVNVLWEPEKIGITKAHELIPLLTEGLKQLKEKEAECRAVAPVNRWGTYKGLVKFVTDYLEACKENPEATVRVSV